MATEFKQEKQIKAFNLLIRKFNEFKVSINHNDDLNLLEMINIYLNLFRNSSSDNENIIALIKSLEYCFNLQVEDELLERILMYINSSKDQYEESPVDVINIESMSGEQFEQLIAKLLSKMGMDVYSTKTTGDGGIDFIALSNQALFGGKYIIQCKRWSSPVGEPVLRDLFGVVVSERANKGILITNSSFTKSAISFAYDKTLELIDGQKLLELLEMNNMRLEEDTYEYSGMIELNEEVIYVRQEIKNDPSNFRIRLKLVDKLISEVLFFENIKKHSDLFKVVKECENHLSIIGDYKHNANDRIGCMVKYLSYPQIGFLKVLQGNIAEGIRYMYKINDMNGYSKYPINHSYYDGPFDRLYISNLINIIHLLEILDEQEMAKSLRIKYSGRIQRIIEQRVKFYKEQLNYNQDDQEYYKSKISDYEKNSRLLEESNLLIFIGYYILFNDPDLEEFYDYDLDTAAFADVTLIHFENDIENGSYGGIFSLDEEEKMRQRKIIRAFL